MMWALLGLLLLLPMDASKAADGDSCATVLVAKSFQKHCRLLCDGAAHSPCSELDLGGIPDYAVVSVDAETGCSATPDVQVRFSRNSGGTSHNHNILLVSGGIDMVVISPVPGRFMDATTTDTAGCTDLQVAVESFFRVAE